MTCPPLEAPAVCFFCIYIYLYNTARRKEIDFLARKYLHLSANQSRRSISLSLALARRRT
jgi:hypothetical protein